MTLSSAPTAFQQILDLAVALDATDKAALVHELIQGTGLSIVFGDLFQQSVSMQINGLDNAGMADVMSAIAEALRDRTT